MSEAGSAERLSTAGGRARRESDHADGAVGSDYAFRWSTLIAIPLAAFIVFRGLYRPISDPDTFWHLRLGEHLWSTWQFAGPEPWSSLAERPLVMHEWAPELLYALAFRVDGYAAVSWVSALIGTVFITTLYICCRQSAAPLLSVVLTLLGYLGASASLSARPQVFSFAFLALFAAAWLRTARDGRARWWLVPLTWVWACCHGLWLVGPALGVVVIAGMYVDRSVTPREAAKLALVPALGILSGALTPVGPRVLLAGASLRDYTRFVTEWAPPSLFSVDMLSTVGVAGLVLVVWLRSGTRTAWVGIAVWATGMGLGLVSARTVALGAVILVVLAASVLGPVVHVGSSRNPSRLQELTAFAIGVVAVAVVGPMALGADLAQPGRVPSRLVAPLAQLPEGTVVMNDYLLGGWLLWELPGLDPVIDGRADVYTVGHFEQTVNAYAVAPGWEAFIEKSHARAAVLRTSSPLAYALPSQLGWRQVARDQGYTLLVPPP